MNQQTSTAQLTRSRFTGLPSFLIVGAARSGTTALTKFLNQHPDVCISDPKEPHFMAFAGQDVDFRGPGDDQLMNKMAVTSIDRYRDLFRHAGNAVAAGEGSVSSLYYYRESIQNIKTYTPDARLLVILRNPVERAYSNYLYMIARGLEPCENFADALDDEERRIQDHWHHIWHYTRLGMYADQIQAYMDAFPEEQLKILLFDNIQTDADAVMKQVFRFIGVNPDFECNTEQEVNRSGKPKNRLLHAAMAMLDQTSLLKRGVKAIVPSGIRERIRAGNLTRPNAPKDDLQRLQELYRSDIVRLQTMTGLDVTNWLKYKP